MTTERVRTKSAAEASILSAVSPDQATTKPQGRSRVTNGSALLPGIDGRSPQARRFRDLVDSFTRELSGATGLTEAQRAMVRQLAGVVLHGENLQAEIVRGEPVDSEQLVRLSNLQSRLLRSLGIGQAKQAPRQKTLQDHLAGRSGAVA